MWALTAWPVDHFNRRTLITLVVTGRGIYDMPIYGLNNCLNLLRVCPVVVHPRRFYLLTVVTKVRVKRHRDHTAIRALMNEF
jgi:hypothetical protein